MKSLLFIFLLVFSSGIFSQSDDAIFNNLVSKDSSSVPVLFSYPDTVRRAIFVASMYPQSFVRLNEIQTASSASLKKTLSNYSRSQQKQLWELTRYTNLISLLINNKDKSDDDLNKLLEKYPDKIKKSAIYFLKKKYSTLVEMETIHKEFETKYKDMLLDFPDAVKTAFNMLLNFPDLVTLLSKDMGTTIALGDLYKRNPKLIKRKGDSLNFVITKENGTEYDDWKTGIANDTTLQKELKHVSKKYAEDMEEDDVYADPSTNRSQNTIINVEPYPYWAGYPNWYGNNYWYPYPWWYNLGFYAPLNGSIMFYGMPTYQFGWWYYNNPRHYNYYPNTSHYFNQHYEGHRNSNSGFNRSVHESYGGGGRMGGGGGGGGGRRR
jgi:uncharacterized membrane protein YgcG